MKNIVTKVSQASLAALVTLQVTASNVLAQTTNLLGNTQINTKNTGFATDLGTVINSVLSFVMVIAALLVLFYLVMGGINWITSGGDKSKTENARNQITAAVVGIIVLAAAYAIFMVVIRFLGFNDTQQLFQVRNIV